MAYGYKKQRTAGMAVCLLHWPSFITVDSSVQPVMAAMYIYNSDAICYTILQRAESRYWLGSVPFICGLGQPVSTPQPFAYQRRRGA